MTEIESWKMFRRCSEGCGEGWNELVGRHEDDLRGLLGRALRRLGVPADRELVGELLQELFYRLLRGRAHAFAGRTDGAMWGYLARMARSVAVDHHRRSTSGKRRPAHAAVDDPRALRLLGIAPPACPEQRLLERERRRLAVRRCARLAGGASPLAPRVLHLALVEGWSSRDIARRYRELTPNQVDRLVSRLRRRLADQGIEMPRRAPRPPRTRSPAAACA